MFAKSAKVKIATKISPKIGARLHQKRSQGVEISNIFSGSMPPDPLGGLWAHAHSLTVVRQYTVKGLSPPTFATCSPPLQDQDHSSNQLYMPEPGVLGIGELFASACSASAPLDRSYIVRRLEER